MSNVREATEQDVPEILSLVKELADYEKEPDAVWADEEMLRSALFGPSPSVFAHMIEHKPDDSPPVVAGFAVWFLNFSTWIGKNGIYLEDLYVRPQYRGLGYGTAMLKTLAQICVERDYGRFEWAVLDWNEPSIGFYKSLGAEPLDEWTTFRLSGDALAEVAKPSLSFPNQPTTLLP